MYRTTRGIAETFLETVVGESLTGQRSASAANVLQAAQAQGIPLAYVDADRLDVLAGLEVSTQAKAFVLDAAQEGYGVMVPERMVEWAGGQAIAWWQLDVETGEVVGVGEDGTHQFLVKLIGGLSLLVAIVSIGVVMYRFVAWRWAATTTWTYFWQQAVAEVPSEGQTPQQMYRRALRDTKEYMRETAWP